MFACLFAWRQAEGQESNAEHAEHRWDEVKVQQRREGGSNDTHLKCSIYCGITAAPRMALATLKYLIMV